jgi:hypothetical protein
LLIPRLVTAHVGGRPTRSALKPGYVLRGLALVGVAFAFVQALVAAGIPWAARFAPLATGRFATAFLLVLGVLALVAVALRVDHRCPDCGGAVKRVTDASPVRLNYCGQCDVEWGSS